MSSTEPRSVPRSPFWCLPDQAGEGCVVRDVVDGWSGLPVGAEVPKMGRVRTGAERQRAPKSPCRIPGSHSQPTVKPGP